MKPRRRILTILLFLLGSGLCAQGVRDTVFIKKSNLFKTAQSIYIDNNGRSKLYDKISSFTIGQTDQESYRWSLQYLKDNGVLLKKEQPVINLTSWVPLWQYKGKFYVYHPCDFYNHFGQSINDSSFVDWTGEGPVANAIISQKKTGNDIYEFALRRPDNNTTLLIHIINEKKGIAVFEQITKGSKRRYYLMIAADKIRSVPIIVNKCDIHKQDELTFDEPDYMRLLK